MTNQFISYGTKDGMVGMDGATAYIDSARKSGVSATVAVAEGKDHGYTFECYNNGSMTGFIIILSAEIPFVILLYAIYRKAKNHE